MIYSHKDRLYFYIYKTTNLITGKIYIGQRRSDIDPEIDIYLGSGKIIQQSIKKHGVENFKKEVLELSNKIDLDSREIYWIDFYNSRDLSIGYNIAKGGEGGYISEDVYKQMSERMSGVPHSKELHIKIIDTKRKNGNLDHKSETKTKISISLVEANKDPIVRMSHANVGEKNGFYEKHHTEETKEVQSVKAKGREKFQCPYCLRFVVKSAFNKFHNEYCLSNPNLDIEAEINRRSSLVSEETRLKIKVSHPKEWSKERKENYKKEDHPLFNKKGENNPNTGRKNSLETLEKMSISQKNLPLLTCPHCGLQTRNRTNINRWHNDNCKYKIIL